MSFTILIRYLISNLIKMSTSLKMGRTTLIFNNYLMSKSIGKNYNLNASLLLVQQLYKRSKVYTTVIRTQMMNNYHRTPSIVNYQQ